jgi:hypothetical protein
VSMLISFEQTGALMSSFYGKDRTLQFLSAASNLNNYTLVLLRDFHIEKILIKAYWTANYCICDRE